MLTAIAEFVHGLASGELAWIIAGLGVACSTCLGFGVYVVHLGRLIMDLPTSRIRSAAQGYVELEGYGRMMPGEPIRAPLSGSPCVWYSYQIEKREEGYRDSTRWRIIEVGTSDAIFHLEDGTGRCVVNPDGAKVSPAVRLCWRGETERPGFAPKKTSWWDELWSFGCYRYTESRIDEYDRLYAVGQFAGLGGSAVASLYEQTRDLVVAWKRDPADLRRRFDSNGDGQLDLAEWEHVRKAAENEIITSLQHRQPIAEDNLLHKPSNGRPFLLSCTPQEVLVARYRVQSLLSFTGFLTFGAVLVWVLLIR